MTLPAHRYLHRERRADTQGARNVAFDVNGVLDAYPREFGTLIAALRAAGRDVYIITAVDGDTVSDDEIEGKRQLLMSLGVGEDMYTELITVPQPHDENKAKAVRDNNIGLFFDNSKANIKAAAGDCVAVLVWNTKEA